MANKQEVQRERTWLALAVPFLLAGAAMIAATDTQRFFDPFFYVGAVLCLIAAWISAGIFVTSRLLPKLPSERAAERMSRARDARVATGDELYARVVTTESDLKRFSGDYTRWVLDTAEWLGQEVSGAKASEFQHATGLAAEVPESFNAAHSNWRLRVSWQVAILRRVEP